MTRNGFCIVVFLFATALFVTLKGMGIEPEVKGLWGFVYLANSLLFAVSYLIYFDIEYSGIPKSIRGVIERAVVIGLWGVLHINIHANDLHRYLGELTNSEVLELLFIVLIISYTIFRVYENQTMKKRSLTSTKDEYS